VDLDVPVPELVPRLADLVRLPENVVVDVGDILDVADTIPLVPQQPAQHVKRQVAKRVAEVSGIVRRDATDIDADLVAGRPELLDGPTQRAVQPQAHTAHPYKRSIPAL
jgi:hypothetical protein